MRDNRPGATPVPRATTLAAALLAGALAAGPAAAAAQDPAPTPRDSTTVPDSARAMLSPGTRVRVTLDSYGDLRVAGRIDSVLATSFVLDTANRRGFLFIAPGPEPLPEYRQMRVRFDEIGMVEVSHGSSRWRGALRWGLIGAAAGGLLTGLSGGEQYNPTGSDMLSAASTGAVAGGLLGGTIGYFTGREVWRRVW